MSVLLYISQVTAQQSLPANSSRSSPGTMPDVGRGAGPLRVGRVGNAVGSRILGTVGKGRLKGFKGSNVLETDDVATGEVVDCG